MSKEDDKEDDIEVAAIQPTPLLQHDLPSLVFSPTVAGAPSIAILPPPSPPTDNASMSSSSPPTTPLHRIRGGGTTRRSRRSTSSSPRSYSLESSSTLTPASTAGPSYHPSRSSKSAPADFEELDRAIKKAKKKKKKKKSKEKERGSPRSEKTKHTSSSSKNPRKILSPTCIGGKDNSIVIDDSDEEDEENDKKEQKEDRYKQEEDDLLSSISATSDEEVARQREILPTTRRKSLRQQKIPFEKSPTATPNRPKHTKKKPTSSLSKKKKKSWNSTQMESFSSDSEIDSKRKKKGKNSLADPFSSGSESDDDKNVFEKQKKNSRKHIDSSSSSSSTKKNTTDRQSSPSTPSRRNKTSRTKKTLTCSSKQKLKKRKYDTESDDDDTTTNNSNGIQLKENALKKTEDDKRSKKEKDAIKDKKKEEKKSKEEQDNGRVSLPSVETRQKRREKENKMLYPFLPSEKRKKAVDSKKNPQDIEIVCLDSDDDDDDDDNGKDEKKTNHDDKKKKSIKKNRDTDKKKEKEKEKGQDKSKNRARKLKDDDENKTKGPKKENAEDKIEINTKGDNANDGWTERVIPATELPTQETATIAKQPSSYAAKVGSPIQKPLPEPELTPEEKRQQQIMDEIRIFSVKKNERLKDLHKNITGANQQHSFSGEAASASASALPIGETDKKSGLDSCQPGLEKERDDDDFSIDPTCIQCWSCEVQLHNPLDSTASSPNSDDSEDFRDNLITQPLDKAPPLFSSSSNEEPKAAFHYAVHAHPLLGVPTCSSCVDEAYAVEDDVRRLIALREQRQKTVFLQDSDDEDEEVKEEEEMDICSWCAGACTSHYKKDIDVEEEEQLLLCDNCPRAFCVRCVALANGGGERGNSKVKALLEDSTGQWACPHCDEPPVLRRMVTALNVVADDGNDTDSAETSNEKETKEDNDDSISVAKLIDELNDVEDGVEEAENALELSTLEAKRKAIEEELRSIMKEDEEEESLKERVEEELDAYKQRWRNHHTCLTDSVTTIQEAMEVKGISLDAFYKFREEEKKKQGEGGDGGGGNGDGFDDDDDDDESGTEPDWKRLADEELNKRDEEKGMAKGEFWGASGYQSKNPKRRYDLDDLSQSDIDEIEDINTLEGTVSQMKYLAEAHKKQRNQWSKGDLTEDDIRILTKKAIPFEKIELEDRVDVDKLERKVVREEDDVKKERNVQSSSMRGKTGKRVVLTELNMFKAKQRAIDKAAKKRRKKEQRRQQNDARKKRRISSIGADDPGGASGEPSFLTAARIKKKRRVATQLVSGPPRSETGRSTGPAYDSGLYLDDVDSEMKFQEVSKEFDESSLALPINRKNNDQKQTVSVSKILFKALKSHQIEGIKFIWENVCKDLFPSGKCMPSVPLQQLPRPTYLSIHQQPLHPQQQPLNNSPNQEGSGDTVRGCILAHNMGLGKSLQVVSVLHTLLTHPLLELDDREFQSHSHIGDSWKESKRLVHRVLLVVPVNTLSNWEDEFKKWFKGRKRDVKRIRVQNMKNADKGIERNRIVQQWMVGGGVLLTSSECLMRHCKELLPDGKGNIPIFNGADGVRDMNLKAFISPGPDMIVLDEAHTMLKNSNTNVFKVLNSIQTKRRIALTGTPLQNNLLEYYRMCSFVRPNCLGSEYDFTRNFHDKIMDGMAADSSEGAVQIQEERSKELHRILKPFVQRCGSSVLAKELPLLQQTVIHVRQSKLQARLYRAFRKYQKETNNNSFFHQYHRLRPVNNHPACLFTKGSTEIVPDPYQPQNGFKNPDEDNEEWWERVITKDLDFAQIEKPSNGGKICLLLEIIARADVLGEKVVVFSQCLKTLNFIEQVLKTPDWGKAVPSLSSISPGKVWGAWRKFHDYLRIDGGTTAIERGELITSFNDKGNSEELERSAKVFLISTLAGGIGINLVAASRVVLYDSHWNPAVDEQALYRCYRYGQEKNVFVYRLLTEGTMEEKIYSRSVNKSSLAARVIDQKFPERSFTKNELTNLLNTDTWVQCDSCDKWRMLPPEADVDNLPESWYCHMNEYDQARSTCAAKERDARWYAKFFERRFLECMDIVGRDSIGTAPPTEATRDSIGTVRESVGTNQITSDEKKDACTQRDSILKQMFTSVGVDISTQDTEKNKEKSKSKKSWISKYYFHDALLEDSNEDGEGGNDSLGIDSILNADGKNTSSISGNQSTNFDRKIVRTGSMNGSVSVAAGKEMSTKKKENILEYAIPKKNTPIKNVHKQKQLSEDMVIELSE